MGKKIISIIGLGYVGLPLALLASKKGYKVYGIDIDNKKVDLINNHKSPFVDEEGEKDLLDTNLIATTDSSKIFESEIIVICVPTPVDHDYNPDLGPVISACKSIGTNIDKSRKTLIILESTVNPGVCEEVVIPTLEEITGLKAGIDFEIAHCPERINPGNKKWNVENINRVVGSLTESGLKRASEFYRSILTGTVKEMNNLKEAEACKIVENCFRDINIAFVNELAMSFDKMDIDVVNVLQGAATKPFAFMAHFPGCGVGGHCIPVDPYYLIERAKKAGFDHRFISLARNINNNMPEYTVNLLLTALNKKGLTIKGNKIPVL